MKKVIKISLASSIKELAAERMEIENFIHNLSNQYENKYQIKLQPFLCEHFDPAVTIGRKQEDYNAAIRDCDFCFFIFSPKRESTPWRSSRWPTTSSTAHKSQNLHLL